MKIDDRKPLSKPQVAENRSQEVKVNATELLNSLKEKERLFVQLKNEGLIHLDRHLKIEGEIQQAIRDLEILLKVA